MNDDTDSHQLMASHQPAPTIAVARPRRPLGRTRPSLSLDRAARWDELLPQVVDAESRRKPRELETFPAVVSLVRRTREDAGLPWKGYDVIVEAASSGELIQLETTEPQAWSDAGATWWVESWWTLEPETGGAEMRETLNRSTGLTDYRRDRRTFTSADSSNGLRRSHSPAR